VEFAGTSTRSVTYVGQVTFCHLSSFDMRVLVPARQILVTLLLSIHTTLSTVVMGPGKLSIGFLLGSHADYIIKAAATALERSSFSFHPIISLWNREKVFKIFKLNGSK
jgi:hypothetical protein